MKLAEIEDIKNVRRNIVYVKTDIGKCNDGA
jgi:hypothetical protein